MKRSVFIVVLFLLASCAPAMQEHVMDHSEHKLMKVHADKDVLNLHDYTLTFERPEITAGKETQFAFTLMKNGQPLPLQQLHGALMHVIIVSKDLEHFDHLHPDIPEPGRYVVKHTFDDAKDYRVWVEYMSDDLEHIVDFDFIVQPAS